ncbi:MAG: restriction endonuclease subunit S [Dehalococcoidia bacterium]|nr:restriction endonuclease subunit S [Dehalococcoidia bacterium]
MIILKNAPFQLPEGWIWTNLGEIVQTTENVSPKAAPDLEFTYIDISSIADYSILSPKKYLGRDAPSRARQVVRSGDVLFSTVRTYLKHISMVGDTRDGDIASTGFCVIRPWRFIDARFVFYLMQTELFLNPLTQIQRGTNYPAVRNSDVFVQTLPLAPLPEQHRIVAKIEELFTRLDAGVQSLNRIKLQLKQYRQAVLKHAFEGNLTEDWREAHKGQMEPTSVLLERIREERERSAGGKHKEIPSIDTSELPELPKGWEWVTLGFWSKEIYRYPTFYGMQHFSQGVPVIRGEHINLDGTISHNWHNYWYVDDRISQSFPRTIVEYGDLIMSVRGSVGKMGFVDEQLCGAQVSPNCLRISPFKDLCASKFVLYFLKSALGHELITRLISATTIQTIKSSLIANINIPLPPLLEQHRIVEEIERCVSITEEIERVVEQSLKQGERLRQSILKRAFEGKLVHQDPTDEPAEKLLERIKAERASREDGKKATVKSGNRFNTRQGRLI